MNTALFLTNFIFLTVSFFHIYFHIDQVLGYQSTFLMQRQRIPSLDTTNPVGWFTRFLAITATLGCSMAFSHESGVCRVRIRWASRRIDLLCVRFIEFVFSIGIEFIRASFSRMPKQRVPQQVVVFFQSVQRIHAFNVQQAVPDETRQERGPQSGFTSESRKAFRTEVVGRGHVSSGDYLKRRRCRLCRAVRRSWAHNPENRLNPLLEINYY